MSRRFGVLWLGVLGVAVLTGCPPTYPKCDSDEQCKSHNEVCVNGQCQECATDANCKAGFVCQANKCTPKPECTNDQNCPAGSTCASGKCTPKACTADGDCGPGARCKNNQCVPNTCTSNDDCGTGESCQAGVCAKAAATDTCNWNPIHFAFNESALTPEARAQLNDLSDCIKKGNFKKITLEGNADERGTEEYNLQLSNRRAASVRKYLVDLGVAPAKLDTVGYGENRPVNEGHNEEAWAANRRVEFRR
jgi:peptidoglycan-associated lipoprotein